MSALEFNSGLRFCENETELRQHHAIHLFDALALLAEQASRGEVETCELIGAIKDARHAFNNTPRQVLARREAEVTAHGGANLSWIGR